MSSSGLYDSLQQSFEAQAYTPKQQQFLHRVYKDWDSGVLADWQIAQLAEQADLVTPFETKKRQRAGQAFSWGLGEDSYDMRLGRLFQRYRDPRGKFEKFRDNALSIVSGRLINSRPLDPLNIRADDIESFEADEYVLPAGAFVLGVVEETIKLPSFIRATVDNKSTLARLGIDASFTTAVRPGTEGHTTLEIKNRNNRDVILRAGDGVISFSFEMMSAAVMNGYAGRYQGQRRAEGPIIAPKPIGDSDGHIPEGP